jgi:hypothetical protein
MAADTFKGITENSFRNLIRTLNPEMSQDLTSRLVGEYSFLVVRQLLEYVSGLHADASAQRDWSHAAALGDLFTEIGR